MAKTKTKEPQLTPEQQQVQAINRAIENLKKRIDRGSVPKNPTRIFKVGDSVRIGALENITVKGVLFDGLGYHIHYDYMGQSYGRPDRKAGDGVWDWTDVFPITAYSKGEPLHIQDDVNIQFYQSSIDSLLHKVYNAGVDFNPDYQRELVWTLEQKVSLLDSIFNNVDIGKFTFIKHDYSRELIYEILDGKQRLSTICEFYEDRITWNGKKFSELCFQDAHHFTGFPIVYGEVGEITEQQIYRLFLKMNTSGTPVSKEHLDKIKSLIK